MERHYSRLQVELTTGPAAILGLWVIAAPFVLGYSAYLRPTLNAVIVGTLVAILAGTCYFDLVHLWWLGLMIAVLGVWLMFAPFVLGYWTIEPATENDIVIGTAIAVLGAWSALAVSEDHSSGSFPNHS